MTPSRTQNFKICTKCWSIISCHFLDLRSCRNKQTKVLIVGTTFTGVFYLVRLCLSHWAVYIIYLYFCTGVFLACWIKWESFYLVRFLTWSNDWKMHWNRATEKSKSTRVWCHDGHFWQVHGEGKWRYYECPCTWVSTSTEHRNYLIEILLLMTELIFDCLHFGSLNLSRVRLIGFVDCDRL